ncbi:MAG: hypothetical protein KGO48_10830 [Alphaproteobacteria bacterium]|nr:hypothetical protein [Alphaproteobacteria bacterium]
MAVRRFAGLFAALRAGFFDALLATRRFALRAGFFADLRAGFLAAALRTVARLAFLRAGLFFAVIGIETTPSRVWSARHAPPKNGRKYEDVGLMKQYLRFYAESPVKMTCEKIPFSLTFLQYSVN